MLYRASANIARAAGHTLVIVIRSNSKLMVIVIVSNSNSKLMVIVILTVIVRPRHNFTIASVI